MNDETPLDPPSNGRTRADTVAITTGRSHAGGALGSVLHASAVWQVDSLEEHRALTTVAMAPTPEEKARPVPAPSSSATASSNAVTVGLA